MDEKLLVRVYNVGLGDCIYVRVPDQDRARHLLIDCGNKYSDPIHLKAAIANLKEILPEVPGGNKRRLDLLVVTHAHEDHVKGFDKELFKELQIDRLWMSTAMNPDHPQAETKKLQDFALQALERLQLSPKAALAEWAESMLALSKETGMEALGEGGLPVGERLYVHTQTPPENLKLFKDKDIRLRVLAPVDDIDGVYLGKETSEALKGFQDLLAASRPAAASPGEPGTGEPAPQAAPETPAPATPGNVSPEDFELLRSSLTDRALAFVLKEGELVNNTSVVLLLEWRGRRLLFTGDAEVKTSFKGEFQEGKSNGSWNVMWHHFKDVEDGPLSRPVDFLKVGHHGSYNATPWTSKKIGDAEHPINAILDNLLPLPPEGQPRPERYAIVSTERTTGYPTIPDPSLMKELGRRVSNFKGYQEPAGPHSVSAGEPQPQRTDLEGNPGERVPWIDIELSPLI